MANLLTTLHASIKTTIPADTGILISVPSGGARMFDEISPTALVGARGAAGQGFNLRGAWAANTAYAAYDVVTYGGSSYAAPVAFTSGATFSTANWTMLASQGLPGASGTGTGTVNTGTTGQLAYYAAGGTVLSSLTLGAGISISSGTLNVSVGGGSAYTGSAPITVSGTVISATIGTAAGTLAAGNDSRIVGALQPAAIPAASGQILGGSGAAGQAIALTLGSGFSVTSGVLNFAGSGVKSDNNTVSIAADGTISVIGTTVGLLTGAPGGPASTDFYSIYRPGGTTTDYKAPVITVDGVTMTMSANGVLSVNTTSTHALPSGTGLLAADELAIYASASASDVRYTMPQITAYTQSNFQSWTTAGRPTPAGKYVQGFNTTLGRFEFWNGTAWNQHNRVSDWSATAAQLYAGSATPGVGIPINIGSGLTLTGTTLAATGSGGGGGSGAPANTPQTIVQFSAVHNTSSARVPPMLRYPPVLGNKLVGFCAGPLAAATQSTWTQLYSGSPAQYQSVMIATSPVTAYSSGRFQPSGLSGGNAFCQALFEVNGFSTITSFADATTVSGNSITATVPASSSTSKVILCFEFDNGFTAAVSYPNMTYVSEFGCSDSNENHGGFIFTVPGSATAQTYTLTLASAVSFSCFFGVVLTP